MAQGVGISMSTERLRHSVTDTGDGSWQGAVLRMEGTEQPRLSAPTGLCGDGQSIPCTALGAPLGRRAKAQPPAVHAVENMLLRTVPLRVSSRFGNKIPDQ